ncbi:exopolysaccharide production repressor protein [Mesorhizobium opportunistum]|uniref:exopolysaccharide production repressor protein n=1 Tax=Mesorhizobium opportunistum TaxID=593909 RepID=UPI003334DA6D
MVLCSTALTAYFASYSIGTVVVTTLTCSLLLQLAYFASVLFLIWRSGFAREAGQGAEHFDSCEDVGCQSPDHYEVTSDSGRFAPKSNASYIAAAPLRRGRDKIRARIPATFDEPRTLG